MRSTLLTLAFAVGLAISVTAVQQKEFSFPHTKKYGRATAEFRDPVLHVVINYDYSQRNHKSPWLLVDVGMASTRRFVLSRDNIAITTPAGRTVPVARQEALNNDAPGVTLVLQNAKIFRRPIATYFSQRNSLLEEMKFQVAPPGTTTVSSEAIVDNDRLTLGGLLFRNPEGSWPSGTYRFAVEHEVAKAALPIVLE